MFRLRQRMKMLKRSAPGWRCMSALKVQRQTQPMQFIRLYILLRQMRKRVSLSPSREYCRKPMSTSTLNLVWSRMRREMRFFPHCPAQQLGTFFIAVMILSTVRFSNMPLSRDILPDTKSRLSVSSYFLKLLSQGSAFIMQLASLSLLIIQRYRSKTGSMGQSGLKLILSNQGFMKISPIYFYSVFTELLGDSWIGACFYCLGLGFGLVMLLVGFMATESFFVGILVLGLLEILGSEELRLSFLSLSDLLSFFLD